MGSREFTICWEEVPFSSAGSFPGASMGREDDVALAEHVTAAYSAIRTLFHTRRRKQQRTADWGRLRWKQGMLNMETAAIRELVISSSSRLHNCFGILFSLLRKASGSATLTASTKSLQIRAAVPVSIRAAIRASLKGNVCFRAQITGRVGVQNATERTFGRTMVEESELARKKGFVKELNDLQAVDECCQRIQQRARARSGFGE